MALGLHCSTACRIFLVQGLNPRLQHWQADSFPLRHQGSAIFENLTSYEIGAIWGQRWLFWTKRNDEYWYGIDTEIIIEIDKGEVRTEWILSLVPICAFYWKNRRLSRVCAGLCTCVHTSRPTGASPFCSMHPWVLGHMLAPLLFLQCSCIISWDRVFFNQTSQKQKDTGK